MILKTLGAFALQDLLKSCGQSKFSTFILHMSAVYPYGNKLIVQNIGYFMHVKQNYLKFRSDGKFHGKLWAESCAMLDNSIEVWVAW